MDRQISQAVAKTYHSSHLMCRATPWGIMGFLACAFFAWRSFSHILRGEYGWSHSGWNAATYVVWIVLLVGLLLDTRCTRERIFFGLLVVNFLAGFGLTLWQEASMNQIRNARTGTGALWALAALASLTTTGRRATVNQK